MLGGGSNKKITMSLVMVMMIIEITMSMVVIVMVMLIKEVTMSMVILMMVMLII